MSFDTALQNAENSVRSGWDGNLWRPHGSLEGGTATLAYGHKLTPREAKEGMVTIGKRRVPINGMTEQEAQELYQQDKARAVRVASKQWPGYENLPDKYKDVLTNIVFNVGNVQAHKWPSLRKAMEAGDDATVRKEMVTSYIDPNTNQKVVLNNRATDIANALELGA